MSYFKHPFLFISSFYSLLFNFPPHFIPRKNNASCNNLMLGLISLIKYGIIISPNICVISEATAAPEAPNTGINTKFNPIFATAAPPQIYFKYL